MAHSAQDAVGVGVAVVVAVDVVEVELELEEAWCNCASSGAPSEAGTPYEGRSTCVGNGEESMVLLETQERSPWWSVRLMLRLVGCTEPAAWSRAS